MKIPSLPGPKVADRPIGTPFENTNFDTGQGQVTAALNQVGAAAQRIGEQVQEAKQKANAINVNDALSGLQDKVSTTLVGDSQQGVEGYLNSRGMTAAEKSVPTLEELEKHRSKISEGLGNDEQRKMFAQHSSDIMRGARGRVEGHVGTERQAAEAASLQGRMATSLTAILNDNENEAFAAQTEAQVSTTLRAFSKSPEDAAAKVEAWQQQVATARLTRYIAGDDDEAAANLYARTKGLLGVHAEGFEKTISKMREKKYEERTAKTIAGEAGDPETGRINLEQAFAKVDDLPEGKREGVRRHLEDRIRATEGAWKRQVEGVADRALTDMLAAKSLNAIKPADEAWLRTKAPDEWDKLEKKDWEWREFWRRRERGDRADRAVTTPDQRQAFIRFQAELEEHGDAYRNMSDKELRTTWMHQLSDDDYEHAGKMWADLKKQPKDAGADFTRAVNEYVNAEPELAGKKKKAKADLFRATVGELRRGFKADNQGKEPTAADFEDMKAAAWKPVIKEHLGGLYKTSKPAFVEGQVEAPPPVKRAPFTPGQRPPGEVDATKPVGAGTVLRAPSASKAGEHATKAAARARELQSQGLTRRQIAEQMNREGF